MIYAGAENVGHHMQTQNTTISWGWALDEKEVLKDVLMCLCMLKCVVLKYA
jgi:hypothetical protein